MADKPAAPPLSDVHVIESAIHEVKALLNQARVVLNSKFEVADRFAGTRA